MLRMNTHIECGEPNTDCSAADRRVTTWRCSKRTPEDKAASISETKMSCGRALSHGLSVISAKAGDDQ
jgi:hypothetical protein